MLNPTDFPTMNHTFMLLLMTQRKIALNIITSKLRQFIQDSSGMGGSYLNQLPFLIQKLVQVVMLERLPLQCCWESIFTITIRRERYQVNTGQENKLIVVLISECRSDLQTKLFRVVEIYIQFTSYLCGNYCTKTICISIISRAFYCHMS